MSQMMINDQESLYKNARELITRFESMDKSGHELIEITGKPKNAASIRDYYNQKNLRRRLK